MAEPDPTFALAGSPLSWILDAAQREASQVRLVRSLFLRLLGMVYLSAFASLAVQIRGLIGERGILPVGELLKNVREQYGPVVFERLPTLLWLGHSDATLSAMCLAGICVSVLIVIDFAPAISLFAAWALYLSLSLGGQMFLDFQWDVFLVETGFLAIFFAPWRILPRFGAKLYADAAPPWPILWMLRWLLFRLFFASGCVKLLSGDPHWQDLTALAYHYESQPLPTWIGWFFFQAPVWFHKLGALFMFYVELIVPFSIFAPRRLRRIGCLLMISLQALIALTGNYTFFSFISIAVCTLMLDDDLLRSFPSRVSFARRRSELPSIAPKPGSRVQLWISAIIAIAIFPATAAGLSQLAISRIPRIPVYGALQDVLIYDFRIVGNYGPFANMSIGRREIAIEGSDDGVKWIEYHWRWKPDDPARRPRFVEPHDPRLDWQMWFAALGHQESLQMMERLMQRLLQGSPEVSALLAGNPFPNAPPKHLRALIYDYHITDWATLRRTGNWWRREFKGELVHDVTLESFKSRD